MALPAPSDRERSQWYFQRYVDRGGVERVLGFCTDDEYQEWLRSCPEFERMLVRSGIILLKYFSPMDLKSRKKRVSSRRPRTRCSP